MVTASVDYQLNFELQSHLIHPVNERVNITSSGQAIDTSLFLVITVWYFTQYCSDHYALIKAFLEGRSNSASPSKGSACSWWDWQGWWSNHQELDIPSMEYGSFRFNSPDRMQASLLILPYFFILIVSICCKTSIARPINGYTKIRIWPVFISVLVHRIWKYYLRMLNECFWWISGLFIYLFFPNPDNAVSTLVSIPSSPK